jgi:hypothetical protein
VSPRSLHLLDHDRLTDFAQPGASLVGAVLLEDGVIESAAWLTHALRVSALPRAAFADPLQASWDALAAEATPARALAYAASLSWSVAAPPPALALPPLDANITLLLDGEVFLEAGDWKLELRGDDLAFLELAMPDGSGVRRLIASGGATTGGVFAPADGWYPIRAAVTNALAAGSLQLRGARDDGPFLIFQGAQLRARVAPGDRGVIQDVFDSPALLEFRSSALAPSLRKVSFGTAAPPDSGVFSPQEFSVRWSGQFLVDSGLEGFTLTTEGGHRLWIDGELRAERDASGVSLLRGLDLRPGWHDLVLELHKTAAGSASLSITEPLGDPTVFEADKLRPVLAPAQRWMSARNSTSELLQPLAPVTRALALPAIVGTAHEVRAEIVVDHTNFADLSFTARLGAEQATLAATGALVGSGRQRFRYDLLRAGLPAVTGGSWVITVADNVAGGGTGTLDVVSVTTQFGATSDRSEAFSRLATYTSPVLELGDVVSFGRALVHPGGAEPLGAAVTVELRSGASAAECQEAAWRPAPQGIPQAPPARFVQYRLRLSGDGAHAIAVDRFSLEYWLR